MQGACHTTYCSTLACTIYKNTNHSLHQCHTLVMPRNEHTCLKACPFARTYMSSVFIRQSKQINGTFHDSCSRHQEQRGSSRDQLDQPSGKPSPCTVILTGLHCRPLDNHTIFLCAITLGVNISLVGIYTWQEHLVMLQMLENCGGRLWLCLVEHHQDLNHGQCMLFLTAHQNNYVTDGESQWYQSAPTLEPLSQPLDHSTVLDWEVKHRPCTTSAAGANMVALATQP